MAVFVVWLLLIAVATGTNVGYGSSSLPPPANFQFQAIDALARDEICQFAQEVLTKVCDTNDGLVEAGITTLSASSLPFVTEADDGRPFDKLFASLTSRSLKIRNLTLLMSLVYLDRVAEQLKVYVCSKTLRKLLVASILVASKLHSNEVPREVLTALLELPPQQAQEAEACIVGGIKDLTIHPQVFLNYCRPFMAALRPEPRVAQVQVQTQHQHQHQHQHGDSSRPPPPPPLPQPPHTSL